MGNCANKPLTNEGEAPVPEEKTVESTDREIVLDQVKVNVHADAPPRLSLAQMLEDGEAKPEAAEASKPAEAVAAVEAAKPAEVEPAKAEASEVKPVEVAAPAAAVVEEKKVEAAPAAKAEEKKVEAAAAAPVAEKK